MAEGNESKVEVAKRQSRYLRGTIAETIASGATHFSDSDTQLLKFHGSYQQDDRDQRKELRSQGGYKAYRFMVRMAIPGGRLTADQYLACDELADACGSGSLRITTRQGFQLHGVLLEKLKPAIAGINEALLTTLAACGDVERNVMACPAPLADAPHALVRDMARDIAARLRPATGAYHEIWLDGEKVVSTEPEEPFYGAQYLPRKFKTGIAIDTDNCIDVFSDDCGLVAIVDDGRVRGFDVVVGGGMGMTHRQADTFAALGRPLGFVGAQDAVEAVRTVAAIFRDHGNREDRRHARLKYLISAWGMERFREEFRRRIGFELLPWVELPAPSHHDHLGRLEQRDGKWIYGVFVENGRLADRPGNRLKTALRNLVEEHRPGVSLTPHQNLLLTDLTAGAIDRIETALKDHGIRTVTEISAARRHSLACPALPTCGLALAEAERIMPAVLDTLETELDMLGLRDEPITIRMTGCPNGCARPYTADIAFVGRRPGVYQIYVGGRLAGDRVADLFAADVPVPEIADVLRPLLQAWAKGGRNGEGLGDYYQRILGRESPRTVITGLEEPTCGSLRLPGGAESSGSAGVLP